MQAARAGPRCVHAQRVKAADLQRAVVLVVGVERVAQRAEEREALVGVHRREVGRAEIELGPGRLREMQVRAEVERHRREEGVEARVDHVLDDDAEIARRHGDAQLPLGLFGAGRRRLVFTRLGGRDERSQTSPQPPLDLHNPSSADGEGGPQPLDETKSAGAEEPMTAAW